MNFSLKTIVAAVAFTAASLASAAVGDKFTLTGGSGTITFGAQGLSGLGVVGVNVIPLAGTATTGASPTLTQPVTGLVSGSTTVNLNGSANIAGAAVSTVKLATAGVQLVKSSDGSNVAKLTNFSFDVASKTLFGDVIIGSAATATNYALYVGTTLTGPTDIPTALGAASVTDTVTGLKLGSSFADAIGAYLGLPQGVVDFTKGLDFGQLVSTISGTITTASVVPEPSTYALMGLGMAGAAFVARRRKAA